MPSNALLGLKEDDSLAQRSGTRGQQKACAETDAPNGHRGHLPSSQDHQTGFRTQGCSEPAQRPSDQRGEPGLSVLLDLLGPRYRLERADRQPPRKTHRSISDARLNAAKLIESNLCRADLVGASFYGAQLTRANLTGAALHSANMRGADLRGANLTGADLQDADLRSAPNLSPQGTAWQTIEETAKMPLCADLRGVDLTGVNLTRADLRGVNLTGVDFTGAKLKGAVLRGTGL